MSEVNIRKIRDEDVPDVCRIYNHYVLNSVATFEEESVSEKEMQARVEAVLVNRPWLVLEYNGKVVGYAYAGVWKTRASYRQTVEASIYLDPEVAGLGLGKQLYAKLMSAIKKAGFVTVIGGISLPNEGSQRLHESLGFQKVGVFKRVGRKFGKWVDVGYWQLCLDE